MDFQKWFFVSTERYSHQIAMATYLILGLTTGWAGFNYLLMIGNGGLISLEPYHVTKIVLSLCALVFSLVLMLSSQVTTGILALFVGLSSFTYSLTTLMFGGSGDPLMDMVYSIPIIMVAVVYFLNKNYFRAIPSLIIGISMFYPYLMSRSGMTVIEGIGLLLAGIMMIMIGFNGLVHTQRSNQVNRSRDYRYEIVVIPGMLLMGVYAVLSSLEYYAIGYYVVSLTLSVTMMVVSYFGLIEGVLLEGITVFFYGLSGVTFAMGAIYGGETYVVTDMCVGLIIGVCGVMYAMRRQWVLAIACITFGIFVVPGFLFPHGVCWRLGSGFMAPFLLYYAVSRWVYAEANIRAITLLE